MSQRLIQDASVSRHSGFTLVELAIVLLIVGILLGGVLMSVTAQIELRSIADTRKSQEEIKDALIGFALANGYFPCPAISAADGREDRTSSNCTSNKWGGFVPWVTLGTAKSDAWGRLFGYSVSRDFSRSSPSFGLTTCRNITMRTRDASGDLINLSKDKDIPAVILSYGRNGMGGVNDSGVAVPDTSITNIDEDNNVSAIASANASACTSASATIRFIIRDNSNNTDPLFGGEFDDLVTWISPHILYNRMVAAGKLP